MKITSRQSWKIIGLMLWISCGFALTVQAQEEEAAASRERYIISARAGGINYVSGNVTVLRQGSKRQQGLTSTDDLESGDVVTTGAGGRIEVLLNPGSYLRVDENSEFELADASLDRLLVKLVKGSAVMEVTGADGVELAISIKTPQAEAQIIRGGIYRFNVLSEETTEIIVHKGRILLDKGTLKEIKGGKKVLITRGAMEIAKLDKKEQDTLDLWSKERAKLLARANQKLQRRSLLTAFNDFTWNDWGWWGQFSRYGNLGLWVYDSGSRSYCFLPGTARAWSSPYGHRYGNGVGSGGYGYDWPRGSGNPTAGSGYQSSGNNPTGTTSGNGNGNPTPAPAPAPAPQPTFQPPPSRPSNDAPIERGPTKVYTDQNPNE
jgi:hypothetical protein